MADSSWLEKDFYQILGVDSQATPAEITRAYRKLAKKLHPDTNPTGTERFKEISAAYDVVGSSSSRAEYDELRAAPPSPPSSPAPGFDDFDSVFSSLFRSSPRPRGADREASIEMGFRDAARGGTTTLSLVSDEACPVCSGSGAAPGSRITPCTRCGGRGMVDDSGPFSLGSQCPVCAGRAHLIEVPCRECHGAGHRPQERKITVRIPAGMEDHQRIRLPGQGQPLHGAPSGDLYVTVLVAPDAVFSRDGNHLVTAATVDFTAAALGTTIEVPTLGDPIILKVPAGTQPEATLRARGRGLTTARGTGDLLVKIHVSVPRQLSARQRTLLSELATTMKTPANAGPVGG